MTIERHALGAFVRDNGDGTATAYDVYRARRATLPVDKATRLLTAFDAAWPRAGYIDSVRHLIEESRA